MSVTQCQHASKDYVNDPAWCDKKMENHRTRLEEFKSWTCQSNRTGTNDAKSMKCLGIFVGLISAYNSGNSFCVRSRRGTDIDCWTGLQGWKRTKNTCSSVHSPSNVQEKTTSWVDTKYVLINFNRFFYYGGIIWMQHPDEMDASLVFCSRFN